MKALSPAAAGSGGVDAALARTQVGGGRGLAWWGCGAYLGDAPGLKRLGARTEAVCKGSRAH